MQRKLDAWQAPSAHLLITMSGRLQVLLCTRLILMRSTAMWFDQSHTTTCNSRLFTFGHWFAPSLVQQYTNVTIFRCSGCNPGNNVHILLLKLRGSSIGLNFGNRLAFPKTTISKMYESYFKGMFLNPRVWPPVECKCTTKNYGRVDINSAHAFPIIFADSVRYQGRLPNRSVWFYNFFI